MKAFKIFTLFTLFTGAISSCTDLYDNVNPNQPSNEANYNFSESALGSVFRTSVPAMEGDDEQRVKSLMVDFYGQILDGGNFDTRYYLMNDDWNSRMFRRVQNSVANLNLVLRSLEEKGDEFAYAKAVAKIWRVYVASVGTDWFGPIPLPGYKGEVVASPPYISVQDAYNEFFTELNDANTLLNAASPNPIFKNGNYDILFGNDKEKWRKFGNSLHLRLAMRLSEADASKCTAEVQKALTNGVMTSAADNAYLPPKADGTWGQNYNYTMFQITWGGPLNMTTTMEKLLTNLGGQAFPANVKNQRGGVALSAVHPAKADPRATLMFDPAFGNGDWKGRPDGLNITKHPELPADNYQSVKFSELGTLYKGGTPDITRPYDVLLYDEVCFLKAEAALRGFASGLNARSLYEEGITVSFARWGTSDKLAAYLLSNDKNLAGTSVNYADNSGAGNTELEKIITQKYLSLFPDVAQEAWNDKRRLNLPRTDVAMDRNELIWPTRSTDVKNVANYIKRVEYPESENTINNAEYQKALQLLGGTDAVNTKVWWDKGKNYCTSSN